MTRTQDPGHEQAGKLVPCLTRTSNLWSHGLERPVLGGEALAIQGFPAYRHLEEILGVPVPFDYTRFTERQQLHMAGNGQNVAAMGVVLLWILAGTAPREIGQVAQPLGPAGDAADGEDQIDDME